MENNVSGIIYKAINQVNGKAYIGQTTKDFEKYKNCHIKRALRGKKKTFYDAIRLYGIENFTWEILKNNINDGLMLDIMETFMIMVHHSHASENGYNMNWGGGDTTRGYKRQDLTARNVSMKGKTYEEIYGENKAKDIKNKMSLKGAGRSKSVEHKKNIGIANKGNKRPDLTARLLERWNNYREIHAEEIKNKQLLKIKKWRLEDDNGNIYYVPNLSLFCREHNLFSGCMCNVAKGKIKQYKGWKCKRVTLEDINENSIG